MPLFSHIKEKYPETITTPWVGVDKSKTLNLERARINLIQCCEILKKHNINYRLILGTLLGIYRSGDLIPHDADMDIAISSHDITKLLPCIDELVSTCGYNVVRIDKNILVSLGKDSDYIDLYIFKDGLKCSSCILEKNDFIDKSIIDFHGVKLDTIPNPVPFFEKYYGGDWETPIKGLPGTPKNATRKKQ